MTYRLKNEHLTKYLNDCGLTDDIIDIVISNQINDKCNYITLRLAEFGEVVVMKTDIEEVHSYDPLKWNPYPLVKPPKEGDYIVTIKNRTGNYISVEHFNGISWWDYPDDEVIAFRRCPRIYKEKK